MNIIIEGNPYLRKLSISILTDNQINKTNKYIKFNKSFSTSKSNLIKDITNLINNSLSVPLYLIGNESNQKLELSKTMDINILNSLQDNFYTIYYEELESKNIYVIRKSLLSTTSEDEYKIIKRTNKHLSPSDYKKHFSSVYDIISNKENNTNKIEKPDTINIKHFILDQSPFSLYADDLNYNKFTLEELQNFKNIEDLFEKKETEYGLTILSDKENDSIILESDVSEKEIIINYGLTKEWFNDLLYLKENEGNILNQIEYQKSNIPLADLQEIATSIIDNDIIFINLTNKSEDGYNRYSSIRNIPFTPGEQDKVLNSKLDTSLLLSEMNTNDTLYNSIDISSFFKYKKPTLRKRKTEAEDYKIQVNADNYSEKFNSDKLYKKYYEINVPFSQKENISENSPSSKSIRLEQIKDSLYKKLKEIIELQ